MSSEATITDARALGRRIRAAREKAGLKQAELARACGVIPLTAWRWEGGITEPSIAMLRVIASITGADLGRLVGGGRSAA